MRLTPRENYLLALVEHTVPEYIPRSADVTKAGGAREYFENGPMGGGLDGFGVNWIATESASGFAVPDARTIVLQDICDWEDVVKFPDLDAEDWQGMAEAQLANHDPDRKLLEYGLWNGQFLRISHLMGFENALCAMFEEPEAYAALMHAITDYKIRLVERVAEYFHPDIMTLYIDVATERGLFMSPTLYRELISPEQARLNEAIRAHGAYPVVHNCGKCDELIPDFIREGYVGWSSAQPMNDIAGILKTYGKDICVIGGYDSNGRPGTAEATDEEIYAEVKRCIDFYAPYGSYVFAGLRMIPGMDPRTASKPIDDAFALYSRDFYAGR